MTLDDFLELFPDDDACLAYLKERFYPDDASCPACRRGTKFHRIRGRSAYSCQFCGAHVYPTVGTIFQRSTTPLQLWFWAVFLVSSTRGRISVDELRRELGVADRTAQRIANRIRSQLGLGEGAETTRRADARLRSIWNARRRAG
jgi:transposase-like protein